MTETIYDALRESHERQRSLCRKLLRSPPDPERRRQLFHELRIELGAHEAAEERYLYVPMLMDDRGLDSSRHALHEHHELDELVEKLQENFGERNWMHTARALSKKVHHHLREEERKFFQVSGKILDDARKRSLASRYRRDYSRMRKELADD